MYKKNFGQLFYICVGNAKQKTEVGVFCSKKIWLESLQICVCVFLAPKQAKSHSRVQERGSSVPSPQSSMPSQYLVTVMQRSRAEAPQVISDCRHGPDGTPAGATSWVAAASTKAACNSAETHKFS
jgi:hypothetical protein